MSIWKFEKFFKNQVEEPFRLTLSEGGTPLEKYSNPFGNIENLYIKWEDKNPSGSFKDRYIAYYLSLKLQSGIRKFALSSSGNAAISAVRYAMLGKCELHVFLSKSLKKNKLNRLLKVINSPLDQKIVSDLPLRKENILLHFTEKPRSDFFKFQKENNLFDLRASRDEKALAGYKTIAYEIVEEIGDLDAVFIASSSGASALGMYQGFIDIDFKIPQFHIVQTSKVHPIAKEFDKDFKDSDSSLASAISDRLCPLKDKILDMINKTDGFGWVISDDELREGKDNFKKIISQDNISFDSLLTFCALKKALSKGRNMKNVLLVFGG